MKYFSSILLVIPFLLILAAYSNPSEQSTEQQTTEDATNGMIQHTVYFYLNSDVTAEEKEQFEAGLEELLEISAIHKAEMGIPAETAEREVTDHAFAYSIFTWFETMEDYKVYAEHPDHMDFIDEYSGLWADVKVYDTNITYEHK